MQLLLLRHAKSSWDDPAQEDWDRQLNVRGKRDAAAMGRYMLDGGHVPALALCSPARRARETWALAAAALKQEPVTRFVGDIYDFGDGDALLEVLQRDGGSASPLLMVGHNPSLEGLAIRLCDRDSGKLRARMEKKYPTATLAVFDVKISDWSQLSYGMGRLTAFVRPKDLE